MLLVVQLTTLLALQCLDTTSFVLNSSLLAEGLSQKLTALPCAHHYQGLPCARGSCTLKEAQEEISPYVCPCIFESRCFSLSTFIRRELPFSTAQCD